MGPHPTLSKLRQLVLRQKSFSSDTRTVHCNAPQRNLKQGFAKNAITTTKYNVLTFLPKGLFEQFRRVANIYFLFHACLSLTPITPVNPVTTIIPLVFVIGVAMIKEGVEDLKRGRSDKKLNSTLVNVVVGPEKVEPRQWKHVRVGDVVLVKRDTSFPGDLVFLGSSDPEGVCFVETMNLDGETNLKVRNAVEATRPLYHEGFGGFDGAVECEQPNPSLYTFAGNLTWLNPGTNEEEVIPLGPENVLLRGSELRNTAEVYGVVIFTGHDTKIMMNATAPPSKRSYIERRLDYIILGQILLLVGMSALTGIWFGVRLSNEMPQQWYLRPDDTTGTNSIASAQFNWRHPAMAGFLQFFTALVLYGYFVPISLYVSIEVTRIIQAAFINHDVRMYHEETNKPTRARTSNLNEELGMIQTILSDKTGTLTRNQMDFFKCSIAGVSYGKGVTEVERAAADLRGRSVPKAELDGPSEAPVEKGFNLRDERLTEQGWFRQQRPDVIRRFLEILAVCHTVIPEGDADPASIKYMAESPDEAAFVTAAKHFGFFFHKRTGSGQTGFVHVTENLPGGNARELRYELLNILEFSSKRRRMSVIVRDPEGKLLLLSKGAETIILQLLAGDERAKEFRRITERHVDEYAEAGLRTLVLAYRHVDESEYRTWAVKWRAAKNDVRSAAEIARRLETLSDEIERDLILVGATAIEDKLQVGVPQTIDKLAKAGIKLWVLTGDKMETAINIGYACSLLRQNMGKHIITLEHPEVHEAEATKDAARIKQASVSCVKRQIADALNFLRSGAAAESVGLGGEVASHGLIIDGRSLLAVFDDKDAKAAFLQLAMLCDSVICCRVSPKQKSQVTLLVRRDAGEICLSVGDGANDVGMIQAANVGVGISGFEGQQAVMASDFAIAQFRFLERLVLVHGGWSYKRISRMITYFFYKNFLFGFTVFFGNAYAMFSGQSIYHDWYLSLFNVVFTSIPIGVVACIDQDVSPRYRLKYPGLYRPGQINRDFSWFRIGSWLLNGLVQAIIVFWFTMGFYRRQSDQSNGRVSDLYAEGTTMFTAVVFIANLQLAMIIQYWTWIHHLAIWGSIVVYVCFLLVLSAFPVDWSGEGAGIFQGIVAKAPSFYIMVLLLIVAALLPDFATRGYIWMRRPEDTNIVQEIAHKARKSKQAPQQSLSEADEAPSARPPSRGRFSASFVGMERPATLDQQTSLERRTIHSPAPKTQRIVLANGALTRERSANGRIEDLSGVEMGVVGNGNGYESDGHGRTDGIVEGESYR